MQKKFNKTVYTTILIEDYGTLPKTKEWDSCAVMTQLVNERKRNYIDPNHCLNHLIVQSSPVNVRTRKKMFEETT